MKAKKHFSHFQALDNSGKVDSVIGVSVVIDGPVSSNKSIRVEGKVYGDVTSKGGVFIGRDSIVNGNLSGKNITVCGVVNGDVTAKKTLIIASKARISGNLAMQSIVIDEGALINGKVSMATSDMSKIIKTDQDDRSISSDQIES